MVSGCLGDETIAAMLEGGLTEDAARRARAHIGGCDACRSMVSAALEVHPAPSATFPAQFPAIAIGAVISGRYRIERLIGEGGMGRVFAARQLGLDRMVAIKVLRPELTHEPTALERFRREARLVASLTSDHVVRVHDADALETGEPYLVMEMLDGEDLATIVARGAIRTDVATAWILAACDALGEAHALGIVHRDVKPSNLLLTRNNRIKVLDFGLAKLALPAAASITHVGIVLGSPHYIAPEQILGARDVDPRADIWSLGATLYHLVTGRPPFAGSTLDAVFATILDGALPPLDGVPADLAAVIRGCLVREPAARFATTAELAAALARPRKRARKRILVGSLAAVAVAGGVLAVVVAQPSADPALASGPGSIAGAHFSIPEPAGWTVASEAMRARVGATPDMVVLMREHEPAGKSRAAIAIGEIDLDASEMAALVGATASYCTELGVESAVTMDADISRAAPTRFGEFAGCEVLAVGKTTSLALRSLTIANGKVAVALVCSHDKSGDPSVDAACNTVANTLASK